MTSYVIFFQTRKIAVKFVIDTNVVVSGLRSPAGVSARLLGLAVTGAFTPIVSVPLVLEYESVCCRPEHLSVSDLSANDVGDVVNALCGVGEEVVPHFLWRPQLRDPSDEMVLEAAVNGRADGLVTFNPRHFNGPAQKFGIVLMTPIVALKRIGP